MNKRIIFHIDVNNAFLSWTAILLLRQGYKTDIRTIPSIIGGDESKRHGIVLAKSPIAKKYGIKTAETLHEARKKCPNLEIFPANHEWYNEISKNFHDYLKKFTPNTLKYSIDEAFLELTGMDYIYDDYIKLAYDIKEDIKRKFGFTVNIGVANNMLCAKMASDFEKPDKVHTLFINEVKTKMWPLPIEDLFMVGRKTSERLRNLGICTIGDLAIQDILFLNKHFKNQGTFLKESANGIDYNKVEKPKTKSSSISTSETFPKDINDINELKDILFRQVSSLARELREKNKYCNIIAIIYKNSNFYSYSKQVSLENPLNQTMKLYDIVINLLNTSWRGDFLRLIGVRFGDLSTDRKSQLSLFDTQKFEDDSETFQKAVDNINRKFGTNSLIPASMKKNVKNNN